MDDKNITLIQIDKEIARGLGAGMKPEIGRKSALENYEDIKKHYLKCKFFFGI
jgi:cell division protein FtsZ